MKRGKQHEGQLARLTTLGGLLGIKTAPLVPRLAPVSAACDEHMRITVTHAFDAILVTTRVTRDLAAPLCRWLDALAGDTLELAIDATSITAWSDEAAVPADAPSPAVALADDLSALGFDGETWTFVFEQDNGEGLETTLARIDELATARTVTPPQRRIAAELHRSLARGMTSRLSLRSRDGALEPALTLAWDRVEWAPIQSMLRGFHPSGGGVDKIARLSRSSDTEHATVELVLGPVDPPGMRFTFDV
ncbi:MAG: hypothetical protein ACKV2T_09305 [Kofleriaceae bacterium]